MDDFKEKYSQELAYQEIKSNQFTLKGFAWFVVGVAFMWLLTVTGLFEVDIRLITIVFVSTFILLIPAACIYYRGDLSKAWLKYIFLTMICIDTAFVFSVLSFHAALVFVMPLLFAVQYRRKTVLWFAYAVNVITSTIGSLASFYYGICDLNILLKSQHVKEWYMSQIENNAINISLNQNHIFIILFFEVFPRCIILLVIAIILQYALISSNEDALRITQLTYLKDTDLMTKAFNKNKYEEMVSDYYPRVERVAVTFWDINNLKMINDRYNHNAGDRAIEKLSSILYDYSDDRHRIYRIGGDEFLLIIDNPGNHEAEKLVESVRGRIEKINAKEAIKISSAVGIAVGKGEDVVSIVKEADEKMYQNKRSEKAGREE